MFEIFYEKTIFLFGLSLILNLAQAKSNESLVDAAQIF
jgi:hypothetical protein